MALFFLLIYLILYLLMPHAWGLSDYEEALPLTVLSLGLCLLFFFLDREPKKYSPQFLLLLFLCPVILVSALANHWLGGGFIVMQEFLLVAVIPFFLFSNLIKTEENLKLVMWICVVSSVIMISNGVSQLNSEYGLGWAGSLISEGTRITYIGVLNDPNDLGAFLVLVLPFSFYFSKYGGNFVYRLSAKLSSLFILYGVYLTNSRGALLATIVMFGVYFFFRFGKIKSIFLGLLSLPLLFFVLSNFREIDSNEESASGRVEAWYEGIEMLKDSPFFGVGMGGFTDYHHLTAHNSLVLVLAELGMIGYGLWFCILSLSFYMVYRIFKHTVQLSIEDNIKQDNPKQDDLKQQKETSLQTSLRLNTTLFYSFLGYLTAIFFLSRSYHFFTFFICALSFSSYRRISFYEKHFAFENINAVLFKLFFISLITIIIMYSLVKILI